MKLTMKLWFFFFGVLMLGSVAYAQSPREQLKQMVEQLQKTPKDNALREKIIKLATSIKPAPAIPEEARRHFVKAVTLQKEAKDIKGYEPAIAAYNQALLIAPWWPEAYFNLSVALESSGRFDEATSSLKLYIATGPNTADTRAAQDKIYALEAKKESAQKIAKAEQAKPDFSGRWGNDHSNRYEFTPGEGGAVSVRVILWNGTSLTGRGRVEGRTMKGTWDQTNTTAGNMCPAEFIGTLSEDSKRLDWSRTSYCGGDPMHFSLTLTRE